MEFNYLIFMVSLVSLPGSTHFQSLIQDVESSQVKSMDLKMSAGEIRGVKHIVFKSPIVLLKQYSNSQRSNKDRLKISRYKAKVNREDTNTITAASEKFKSKLSTSGDHIFGSILISFGIISVLGNGCTFAIFYHQCKQLKPVEIFFVHQAINDVLLTFGSYPFPIIASFSHQWIFGNFGCTVYGFVCYFLELTSVLSITSIAVFRYLIICVPSLGSRITCLTSNKVIICGKMIALAWTLLPIFGVGKYDVEPFGLDCAVNWIAKDTASRVYLILGTVVGVCLPLSTLGICYFEIIKKVYVSGEQMDCHGVQKRKQHSVTAARLTWMGVLAAAGFAISWIPITIAVWMSSFREELSLPLWTTPIPALLVKCSPALNPLVYVFCTKQYWRALISLLNKWIQVHGDDESQQNNEGKRENEKLISEYQDNGKEAKKIENESFDSSDTCL